MTVVPSADGAHLDAMDESFVARLANNIFRQGPELGAFAADRAEDGDAVPGHGANAATDLAAKAAGLAYRADPSVTDSIPRSALPGAVPGSLGIAASSPSSFLLRSAPLGAALPAETAQPWRHVDAHRWQGAAFRGLAVDVPYTTGPMMSDAPGVGALRQLVSTPLDASAPAGSTAAPVSKPGRRGRTAPSSTS